MNYPIWETTFLGGPTLIAIIAVFHVYIAHLAVGGGLFLWLTDLKGWRENSPAVHGYLHKHIWFFLLLTMVFGGVTGVGIWFIIALVSPAATTTLIHNFVFGWSVEWVFFFGEIAALLIYHYYFDRLGRKKRLNVAFLYFLFAWLSLFVINGIIDFMLTPGKWLESGSFWDGLFNPTFFPSLFFRSFAAFTFAGLFGYVTTVFLEDEKFRRRMLRYCTKWLLLPMIGLVPSALWYFYAVPETFRQVAFSVNRDITPYVHGLLAMTVAIFILGVLLSVASSRGVQKAASFLLIPAGLFWMGGFEYTREIARKPYVIAGYMYSNSILVSDAARLDREGVLASAKWSAVDRVDERNALVAGRELFNLQCLSCHTVNGVRNDIVPLVGRYAYRGLVAQITGQGKIRRYMPPCIGTQEEKEALAAYIYTGILGREVPEEPFTPVGAEKEVRGKIEIPPFEPKQDKYVLLVWNDLGMHCVSDCDEMFSFLPPANTLEAQLIRRGPVPELVTEGVQLTYQVEPGHGNPGAHVRFWEFSEPLYGVKLENNTGLAGKGLAGEFDFKAQRELFVARWIPVVPYRDDGTFNPYPVFTVQARDVETGALLVQTKVVAPVSTEADCYRCHGGQPRKMGSGISTETAANILQTHDRNEGTGLYSEALAGRPRLCQSCHADLALEAEGEEGVLNFSASMHGWHANYMAGMGDESCMYCHPIAFDGMTRCLRGVHGGGESRVVCSQCHGKLEDLAVSLLNARKELPRALEVMQNLTAGTVPETEPVKPRTPWIENPDCFACHEDFQAPGPNPSAFNLWNETTEELYRLYNDNALIKCIACHGSTHAIYPATNPFDKYLDVIQPMQYGRMPYTIGANKSCAVCHVKEMEDPIHHENMWRMVRNRGGFTD